jgi:D-aminopeptidase
MSCFGMKGGIGTSSRVLPEEFGKFTVGILVLANFGRRSDLVIDGVPVGRELHGWDPAPGTDVPSDAPVAPAASEPASLRASGQTRSPACQQTGHPASLPPSPPPPTGRSVTDPFAATRPPADRQEQDAGSVMVILGTDAPLTDRQLGRLARRVGMGLARTGSIAGHGSGDFVIAFANSCLQPLDFDTVTYRETRVAEEGRAMGALFQATIEATEESVVNALFAADTVEGRDGHVRHGLPVELVQAIMRRHGRLRE